MTLANTCVTESHTNKKIAPAVTQSAKVLSHNQSTRVVALNKKIAEVKVTNKSNLVKSQKLNQTSKKTTTETQKVVMLSSKKATYKIISTPQKNKEAVIYIGTHQVIKYAQATGGVSPENGAKLVTARLDKFLSHGGNPNEILPGIEGGIPVGRAKGQIIFTTDQTTAKKLHLTRNQLAIKWVNNIRVALGAPRISRDFARIASRNGISIEYARRRAIAQEAGVASWYGGKFDGRKAADGSIYRKYEFTAAHKTLPLGTFVRVTNLNNNKACIVQITDRGPFVPGRIIDLSKEAAKDLQMLHSGVSKVKLEVIDRF